VEPDENEDHQCVLCDATTPHHWVSIGDDDVHKCDIVLNGYGVCEAVQEHDWELVEEKDYIKYYECSVCGDTKTEIVTFTVTYLRGAHGTWTDDVHTDVPGGDPTPAFRGNLLRQHDAGWQFAGWKPQRGKTVTGDATYTAQWTQIQTGTPSVASVTPAGGGRGAGGLGAGDPGTGVLGAFSRGDIVTDNGWVWLDSEYETEEQGDAKIFHVIAPLDEDGSYALRYMLLTPELYAELKADGYTHISFELGDAAVLVSLDAFRNDALDEALDALGLKADDVTFVLMLDFDEEGDIFLAGAYAKDGEELHDIFDKLPGISLTNAEKLEEVEE